MTGNCGPGAEQLVASVESEEEATLNRKGGKGGYPPARMLEFSVGTGGRGSNTTAIDLEQTVEFAQREHGSGTTGFPGPTLNWAIVESRRIPSAAGEGARSMSGLHAAAAGCTAIDSGELGIRVQ
jgi:hypothetical protein